MQEVQILYRYEEIYMIANIFTVHIFLHFAFSEIHKLNKEISLTHEEIQLNRPRHTDIDIGDLFFRRDEVYYVGTRGSQLYSYIITLGMMVGKIPL